MDSFKTYAGFATDWFNDFEGYAAVFVCRVDDKRGSPHFVFQDVIRTSSQVPYQSGHLAERDVPAYLKLFQAIPKNCTPDVLLVDGAGKAHPRKAGTACVLGEHTGMPTIGVTKTLFKHLQEKDAVPVRKCFVSVGRNLSLAEAVDNVRSCHGPFRKPWPIRCARVLARSMRRM